jgi:hypothetical protein
MRDQPLSDVVIHRLESAAQAIGTASPTKFIRPLLERTFPLPLGDDRYASNVLTPGAAPLEPSYSELEPGNLRFTIEPLGPEADASSRRNEATREVRRLVGPIFGGDALRWFDRRSEAWRGPDCRARLNFGAFFGSAYDRDGLSACKVYYELLPQQIDALPADLIEMLRLASQALPRLTPLFTSITCRRGSGAQRLTCAVRGAVKMADVGAFLNAVGLSHALAGMMQVLGVALGGRFEFPPGSVLISLGLTPEGPEVELYVLLERIPDVPPDFLGLISLGMAERPRHLRALSRWLQAFNFAGSPDALSIISVHAAPDSPPRMSLYLRPSELEVAHPAAQAAPAMA